MNDTATRKKCEENRNKFCKDGKTEVKTDTGGESLVIRYSSGVVKHEQFGIENV